MNVTGRISVLIDFTGWCERWWESIGRHWKVPTSALSFTEKWSEMKVAQLHMTLRPHGWYSPWNSPGQNTGMGSLSLLQWMFPTQGSNPGLLHCRRILYQLSHQGRPLQRRGWCYLLAIHGKARMSLGNISEEASLKSLHNKWFSSCESLE